MKENNYAIIYWTPANIIGKSFQKVKEAKNTNVFALQDTLSPVVYLMKNLILNLKEHR